MAAPASNIGRTVVKLAVASLLVGLVLSAFDISPRRLLRNFGETVQQIFDVVVSMVEWAVPYILLGAVVVIPIWIVLALARAARNRR